MSTNTDVIIKGAMLGDFNVGKSSIFQRFMHNELHYNPTIGVDFQSKTFSHCGKNVRLHLWDTAGQERFRSIVQVYMRNIHVFFLVIDVTQRSSFDHLDYWVKFIRDHTSNARTMHRPPVEIVLLVNKTDTPATEWAFTKDDINAYCGEHGEHCEHCEHCEHTARITSTYYVSAQTESNTDIHQLFSTTIQKMYNTITHSGSVKGMVDHHNSTKTCELHTPPGSPPCSPPTTQLSSKDVMTAIGFNNYSPRTECCSSHSNTTSSITNRTNRCCF